MARYQHARKAKPGFNLQSLPLLQDRKPPTVAVTGAGAPAVSTSSAADDAPVVLTYSSFIEQVEQHALFDRIRGRLTLQAERTYIYDPEADAYELELPTPQMDFEAIVRKLPPERTKLLRTQVRQEHPMGNIEGYFADRFFNTVLEKMALTVHVEGENRSDYAAMARPLVGQAYGLLQHDNRRSGATSGEYTLYDFAL